MHVGVQKDQFGLVIALENKYYDTFINFLLQKWSKGKVRDKLNNLVLYDKGTYEKLYKEVPNYKLITPSVVSERLKVRGSLAKKGLRELNAKGMLCGLMTITEVWKT